MFYLILILCLTITRCILLRLVLAAKIVEFVSNSVSYIVLTGCRCNIIVLNVRATGEVKVTIQKTVFMRNLVPFSIIILSNI